MCQYGKMELIGPYGRATECPDPRSPRTKTVGLQIGDHRLSTSYVVVERPDHHCGDDLGSSATAYISQMA